MILVTQNGLQLPHTLRLCSPVKDVQEQGYKALNCIGFRSAEAGSSPLFELSRTRYKISAGVTERELGKRIEKLEWRIIFCIAKVPE